MDMFYPSRNKNRLISGESLDGIPTHQLVSPVKSVVESRGGVPHNVTGLRTRRAITCGLKPDSCCAISSLR